MRKTRESEREKEGGKRRDREKDKKSKREYRTECRNMFLPVECEGHQQVVTCSQEVGL